MGEAGRAERRSKRATHRHRPRLPPARRQRPTHRHAQHHSRPAAVTPRQRREAVSFSRVLIVRRATRLEELIARFNTKPQARFYIESAGGDFGDYDSEDSAYKRSLDDVVQALRNVAKTQ